MTTQTADPKKSQTVIEEVVMPSLYGALSEGDMLSIKLQEEITHLEKWMASQLHSNRKANDAIVSTIQGLIQTRKKLLESIEP